MTKVAASKERVNNPTIALSVKDKKILHLFAGPRSAVNLSPGSRLMDAPSRRRRYYLTFRLL